MAQPVAKAICLLQYVRSVHRTAENIAAALHPGVEADSRLTEVNAALAELETALMIRKGQDGYRIPTPAEDDWERQRASLSPKGPDVSRIYQERVQELWQPQPSHNFLNTKIFKAGVFLNGRELQEGDIAVHLSLDEEGKNYQESVAEARKRSQTEGQSIFWIALLNNAIDRETVEVFRSKDILSRKQRTAKTKDELALVSEEGERYKRHLGELTRLLKQACLTGTIFFRGNDRSPDDKAAEVYKTAAQVLALALPEVFDRFEEAAARIKAGDLDALMTTENLRGLPPAFTALKLVREQNGKPVFSAGDGPLAEVLARIADRTSYGETASGRWLTDELSKEPFGWDFDVVRLFVVSLIRAGKIEATSKGQLIDNALSIEARNTFVNNNLFRQASFQTKATQSSRKLLEREYREQLEGAYDILLDGRIAPQPGAHLDPRQRLLRRKLVGAIRHKTEKGVNADAAVADYLREAAFTTLNRFVALKMLEARALVRECISRGEQSAGFREFGGLAPGLVTLADHGYRMYLECLFDEIGREVRALFDRRDEASLPWPRQQALKRLLDTLNAPELGGVWAEDETIGWVYQYFNSQEERRRMRDDSAAPQNSHELAVRNQFFTPRYVVQFLTDNTLGRMWYEMRKGDTALTGCCQYLVRRPNEEMCRRKKDPREIRVLDPACGSGHFLLYCFDLLLAIYEEAYRDDDLGPALQRDYPGFAQFRRAVPELILRHNLHGIDIDARCAQIAALALWMRAQRAYRALGLKPSERPEIKRINIVYLSLMDRMGIKLDRFGDADTRLL